MKTINEIAEKLFKKVENHNPKRVYSVIARNNGWYNPSVPAGRIVLLGFFNDQCEEIESTDELINCHNRTLRSCGEFADLLGGDDIDYLSIR